MQNRTPGIGVCIIASACLPMYLPAPLLVLTAITVGVTLLQDLCAVPYVCPSQACHSFTCCHQLVYVLAI
jgi:hypothetical protein